MDTTRDDSIWLDRDHDGSQRHAPLDRDLDVDVAVVGGGIVGTAAAMLLSESGLATALLEARSIGAGTTGNSTAKATLFHGTGFTDLIDAVGADDARLVIDGDRAALDVMRHWAADGLVEASAVPHWAWTASEEGRERLERERGAAKALGIATRWADDGELPFGTGALGVDDQLLVEPALMCRALAKRSADRGVHVFEGTRVIDVDLGERVDLGTQSGHVVRARHVVLATQIPILDRTLVFAACSFRRSHGIALELPDAFERLPAMYTGIDDDGLSLRPARTGDGRPVAVVAGHGHPLDEDEDGTHVDGLVAHAQKLLGLGGDAGELTNAWLAHDAFPSDGRPFVGPAHGADNVFVATGFAGWGLARGVSASLVVTSLLLRGHTRWRHPLDARRISSYVKPSAIKQAATTAVAAIRDRLSDSDIARVESLAPGEGDVFGVGRSSVAVARDERGALHAVDAACTHLGCIVRYDAERRQWQCPCHASRFDIDGAPLAGPATAPLAPFELDG